jgi:hypothetical protein
LTRLYRVTTLPVGFDVGLRAQHTFELGCRLYLFTWHEDGHQCSTHAPRSCPTAYIALSGAPDAHLDNAITCCPRDSSVYGLQRNILQDQLFRLPPTSALWSISVTLLDFHECAGRRRHNARQIFTKALSSFDIYRILLSHCTEVFGIYSPGSQDLFPFLYRITNCYNDIGCCRPPHTLLVKHLRTQLWEPNEQRQHWYLLDLDA